MLSNIVAGTSAQLALACDTPGVLASVIELLSSDVWDVQKEATFVVSNVATAGKGENDHACMHMLGRALQKANR